MKILLDRDIPLTTDIINRMIQYFTCNIRPQLQNWFDYYNGNQEICRKEYADETTGKRVVSNFCKNITEVYNGYMGSNITYNTDEQAILDILKWNDVKSKDSNYLEDALIFGEGIELMWVDESKTVRFDRVDPRFAFGIFANDMEQELLYFVRIVPIEDWDFVDRHKDKYMVYIYDDKNVTTYSMLGMNGNLNFIEEKPHYFNQCPANIFYIPNEESIFNVIMSLQDSYNEALSDSVADSSYFSDAYLLIKGAQIPGETETEKKTNAQLMRQNRIFEIPYDSADMSFLTKGSNNDANNTLLTRLREDIYRTSQCPDYSDINFSSASSGISLRFKLSNIEVRSIGVENAMRKALTRRIELICGFVSLKFGDDIWRDCEITFVRNIPDDTNEILSIVTQLQGIVSKETLLSQLPFVKDVKSEIDKVNEEKEASMEMYASNVFGNIPDDDTEDTEEEDKIKEE